MKPFFCFLFFVLTCLGFAQAPRLDFYSKYSICNKTEPLLSNIENKILNCIDSAIKTKKRLPFHIYSGSDWRMEFTVNELFLNETTAPPDDYELMIAWNQFVDSGYVTGYSKMYDLKAVSKGQMVNMPRQPLRAIPLGEYNRFLAPGECAELSKIIKQDLIKKWEIKILGEDNLSVTQLKIDDSLGTYNAAIFARLARIMDNNRSAIYYPLYSTADLKLALMKSETDILNVSFDTINVKTENHGSVETYLKSEYSPTYYEVVNKWIINPADEKNMNGNIPPLLTVTRTTTAIGIVFNKKRAYMKYEDFKALCLFNKIDYKIYESLFEKAVIDQISIEYE